MKSKTYAPCEKLSCDWTDEKKHLIHYSMLKLYVKHGMVVEKVHDINSFRQKPWLKTYILSNTKKRALSKTEFDKQLPKGMNCSSYGKPRDNVRNRIKMELIKKMRTKNCWICNHNYHLTVCVDLMIGMIVKRLNKSTYYWINPCIQDY